MFNLFIFYLLFILLIMEPGYHYFINKYIVVSEVWDYNDRDKVRLMIMINDC